MRAIHFENGRISMRDKPRPVPGPGQALLRPVLAGICNTDIELFLGYYNYAGTPGHEFAAVVVEAPDKPGLVGKRVVADINCGCGRCPGCLGGDSRHCPDRKTIGIRDWDGAFAEYLLAPINNLHLVDDSVPDEQAVMTELLAAALEPARQFNIRASDRVLVLGDGKLGLLCAMSLIHFSPNLVLAGRHERKLALARRSGVETVLADSPDVLPGFVNTRGLFDIVVEATGRAEGVGLALDLVRPEGIVAAKTTSHAPSQIDLAKLVVNEIRLEGSRCGDPALALEFLRKNMVDAAAIIEAVHPFKDFEKAFEQAREPGAGKIIIRFD